MKIVDELRQRQSTVRGSIQTLIVQIERVKDREEGLRSRGKSVADVVKRIVSAEAKLHSLRSEHDNLANEIESSQVA